MYSRGAGRSGGGGRVCDFFLQGRCRYGDNCKNEHPRQSDNNRFSALSNAGAQRGHASPDQKDQLPFNIHKDVVIADLKNERPIWPFSAYGPGRDAPRQLFGGYPLEQSPEELRCLYYLAQSNGNPQPAIQAEQDLLQQMNQQIEKVLADPDGAIKYVLDGENEHPNRRDLVVKGGEQAAMKSTNPFSSNTATTSAFGQPSASGAAKPAFGQPSFGQPSNPQPSNPFGGAAKTSTFGQPSQPGVAPAFGQPSQPTGPSAFGQPSQIGANRPAFGQPSQPNTGTAFGQPSQPNTSTAFGQPTSLGGGGAFGQPSALGQNKPAFGQPSQPANPFSSQAASNAFGQPNQPNQSSPFASAGQAQQTDAAPAFGQPSQSQSPFANAANQRTQASPFASAAQSGATTNPNPFGQPTQTNSSPFAQAAQQQSAPPQANTSAPFGRHAHPAQNVATSNIDGGSDLTSTPPLDSYAQIGGNNRLRSWRNRPVVYIENEPYYSRTGNTNNAASLERIWHPNGAPGSNPYTEANQNMYTKAGADLERQYRSCAEQGRFEGEIPLIAPKRAWVRFDV